MFGDPLPGADKTCEYATTTTTTPAPSASLTFAYGPEHQRVKQIAPGATTYYLHPDNAGGLLYEKEVKADGSTEHKHFITTGKQLVAVVKQTGGVTTVRYFHQDHLGSTTAITDAAGTVVERLAYEPFGKRRFPAGGGDANNTVVGVNTDRGFTGHEHLDELGLIHMNGRVYDPLVGRFMSADPNVPNPLSIQSFNRYAYTRNNPLTYVDPDGFSDGYFSLDANIAFLVGVTPPSGATSVYTHDNGGTWQAWIPNGGLDGTVVGLNSTNGSPSPIILPTAATGIGGTTSVNFNIGNSINGSSRSSNVANGSRVIITRYTGSAPISAGNSGAGPLAAPGSGAGAGAVAAVASGLGVALTSSGMLRGDTAQEIVYLTYTRYDPIAGQTYAGRTHGYAWESNETILHRRAAGQPLLNNTFGLPEVDQRSTNYAAIRGREQQLIDFYGGALSVGGTARNKINGVSDWNINRPSYISESIMNFGALPDNSPDRLRFGPEVLNYLRQFISKP